MSEVYERTLALARSEPVDNPLVYISSQSRKVTRRGILWLGQTCNLRCHFCYFLDRITDDSHPEHGFMSLEKAKTICKTLVDYYGNNSIDIQGGEPTLYPPIYDLVAYCAEIGLSPTLITNAIALSKYENAERYKEAGIRDFLVSVQGLGEVYDQIVGRPGGHAWQMKALNNLQKAGIPFRFNTVLSKKALPQLMDISKLAVDTGAGTVNFLGFNPFNDQTTGKRSADNVPSYNEIRDPLEQAVGYLLEQNVEVNVRYLPQCLVPESMRKTSYGFKQLPYDLHENDYASWSWTDLPAQRTAGMELTPPFKLGKRLELGAIRGPLRTIDRSLPKLGRQLHRIKQGLERNWANNLDEHSDAQKLEMLYQKDAELRAKEYTGYHHVEACSDCSIRALCDGVYGDYAQIFGLDGLRPVKQNHDISDIQHYTRTQHKVVHPLDQEWLETGGEPVATAVMDRLANKD